jgi:YVTN family beta-propeller protein
MLPLAVVRRVTGLAGAAFLGGLGALVAPSPARASFVTFESGQVRPLALAPGGGRLFAVNTPDNQLEIFDVDGSGLTHVGSVPVGLEPVAVAARTDTEVWVVNHLSDSVSVVDLSANPPRVVRSLLVGDEPRDIVFAGPGRTRAFITTARRGQNVPITVPPKLTTPSTPRALVWVFDATALDATLTGTPLAILELFGDTPRALDASPDGSRVYAAQPGRRLQGLHAARQHGRRAVHRQRLLHAGRAAAARAQRRRGGAAGNRTDREVQPVLQPMGG